MRRLLLTAAIAVVVAGLAIEPANAQTINVWPGVAPGSERWTHKERALDDTPIGPIVQNVVTPTLTAFLPEPGKATFSRARIDDVD